MIKHATPTPGFEEVTFAHPCSDSRYLNYMEASFGASAILATSSRQILHFYCSLQ